MMTLGLIYKSHEAKRIMGRIVRTFATFNLQLAYKRVMLLQTYLYTMS